jgi:hypothetical protein
VNAVVPVRLAVVGSTSLPGELAEACASTLVHLACTQFRREIETDEGYVVSGGAEGVDTVARSRAATFGWTVENRKFVEHLPKNRRWEPDGFKARDKLIAQDRTHLLRVYRPDSKTYGSGWTADRAEALGKVVRRYVWDAAVGRFVKAERVAGGERCAARRVKSKSSPAPAPARP